MKITLKSIASEVGVSQVTVSRVLNGKADGQVSPELASRIRETANHLQYAHVPTANKVQKLSGAKDPKIYLLTPTPGYTSDTHGDWLYRPLVEGACRAAALHGVRLEVLPVSQKNDNYSINWEWLEELGPGSRILSFAPWMVPPLLELSRRGCHIAFLQGEEFWRELYAVNTSSWAVFTYQNRAAAVQSLRKLLAQKYRRIAVIGVTRYISEPYYIPYSTAESVLGKRNIDWLPVDLELDQSPADAIGKAYEKEPFDALAAPSLNLTLDENRSLQSQLNLPDSVKIVLRNHHADYEKLRPVISMVQYPIAQMAADAVEALLEKDFHGGERLYQATFIE